MKTILTAAFAAIVFAAPAFADNDVAERFVAAMEAGDSAAIGATFTEDASSYSPDGLQAYGREAIAASWQGFLDAYEVDSLTLNSEGSRDAGDIHAEWGLWQMNIVVRETGEAQVWNGRYMDVSEKIDGVWLYVADHASMMAPPAE